MSRLCTADHFDIYVGDIVWTAFYTRHHEIVVETHTVKKIYANKVSYDKLDLHGYEGGRYTVIFAKKANAEKYAQEQLDDGITG